MLLSQRNTYANFLAGVPPFFFLNVVFQSPPSSVILNFLACASIPLLTIVSANTWTRFFFLFFGGEQGSVVFSPLIRRVSEVFTRTAITFYSKIHV